MSNSEELREKIKRINTLQEISDKRGLAPETPVSDSSGLLAFISEYPGPRRWYLSRVYSPESKDAYVDMYFAPPSDEGLELIDSITPNELKAYKEDNPNWWAGEEFDLTFHIPLGELQRILEEDGGYVKDEPLVEGMVFVEMLKEGSPYFVPFTYQARQASKTTYKKLLSSK